MCGLLIILVITLVGRWVLSNSIIRGGLVLTIDISEIVALITVKSIDLYIYCKNAQCYINFMCACSLMYMHARSI